MKYFRGFMMAWGNFSSIPCPSSKWYEECRGVMLNMLPLIGAFMGIICAAVWKLLSMSGTSDVFTGIIITALYFWMTGFIHLDGFMDCSDAILSRRPDMEERRRILKDSHVGAFAVISLAFMLMLFAGSLASISQGFTMRQGAMFIIVLTCSRTFAVRDVITKKPMSTSQYNGTVYDDPMEKGTLAVASAAAAAVIMYAVFIFDFSRPASVFNVLTLFYTIVLVALMKVVTGWAGSSARKQLGGMNGDISGCMIVLGEMAGVILIALLSDIMNLA